MARLSSLVLGAFALAAVLGGCGGFAPVLAPDSTPSAEFGYLYGRFVTYGATMMPIRNGIVVAARDGKDKSILECRMDNKPSIVAVRPGPYFLRGIGYPTGEVILPGENRFRPGLITETFQVESGKAYYLGDFSVFAWNNPGWYPPGGLRLSAFADNFEATTTELRTLHPGLASLPAARAIPRLGEIVFRGE